MKITSFLFPSYFLLVILVITPGEIATPCFAGLAMTTLRYEELYNERRVT